MGFSVALCGTAGVLVILALGNLGAALVLPYWLKDGGELDTGLFIDCDVSDWPDNCGEKFDPNSLMDDPTWLNIVRVLLVLALLLGLLSFLGYFCFCCCDCRKCLLWMQLTCNLLAAAATVGGVVYYDLEIGKEELETGISYSLAIGAATFFCGATLVSAVDLCRGEPGSA